MIDLASGVIGGKVEDDACAQNGVFVIKGMITGRLEVKNKAEVTLNGMVCGDVVTYNGSRLLVFGMILGSLLVKGGVVEIYGMICKDLINDGGKVTLNKDAKVLGNIRGQR